MIEVFKKYGISLKDVILRIKKKDNTNLFGSDNIRETKEGQQLQVTCPFHTDSKPSMGINIEKNAYHCFVCSNRYGESKYLHPSKSIGKGSIYQFLRLIYEFYHGEDLNDKELISLLGLNHLSLQEQFDFLNAFKGGANFSHFSKKVESLKKGEVLGKSIYGELLYDLTGYIKTKDGFYEKDLLHQEETKYPYEETLSKYSLNNQTYLQHRLLGKNDISYETYLATLNNFDIKTLDDGSILIPIFHNHYLVGLYCRHSNPSYTRYSNILPFKKTLFLYNWDDEEVQKSDNLILVEGPLNCIRLWSLGYRNVVSLFSASPYKEQIKLLSNKKEITVWFDNDQAGQNSVKELRKFLPDKVKLYSLITGNNLDCYDYNREEIQDFLNTKRKLILRG